jgi:hypothetical protein
VNIANLLDGADKARAEIAQEYLEEAKAHYAAALQLLRQAELYGLDVAEEFGDKLVILGEDLVEANVKIGAYLVDRESELNKLREAMRLGEGRVEYVNGEDLI